MGKVNIEEALEQIEALYSSWNIPPKDWRFVCGWALRLQGYEVTRDLECIDTVVLKSSLPWESDEIYMTVPVKEPEKLDEYTALMERIGFDIHIHFTTPQIESGGLPEGIEYRLPNGRLIYLIPVLLTIKILGELIQLHTNYEGEEGWIQEHLDILREIRDLAMQKGDLHIVEECDQIIQRHGG